MSTILESLNAKNGVSGIKKICEALQDIGLDVDTIYISPDGIAWFGKASDEMITCIHNAPGLFDNGDD